MKKRWRTILSIVGILVGCGVWIYAEAPESVRDLLPTIILSSHKTSAPVPSEYIEVTGGCGPHFEGECALIRSGAGTDFPVVEKLRTGIVLAVATSTKTDDTGRVWYQVIFNEWVRYPERISSEWYVAADYVRHFEDTGNQELAPEKSAPHTDKHILIDRSEQTLYAYDGDTLFLEALVSTGLDLTPTPRGVFTVYKKTPTRYMQGPLPGISDQYYDLPGVPWNLYFTAEGGAIHGAYWHNEFGKQWSHGCVNLPLTTARTLYEWAPLGTQVVVQD